MLTADTQYCSFCWSVLPPEATECADCGRSVAEMEATRAERAEADRNWLPPRLVRAARQEPAAATLAPPVEAIAANAAHPEWELRYRWKDLLLAVGAGSFLGGASVSVAWLVIVGFPDEPSAAPVPKQAPRSAVMSYPATVHVEWDSPYEELRLQLLTPAGKVVAASHDGEPDDVAPGDYRLRIVDRTGRWTGDASAVQVPRGKKVTLTPTPGATAEYYLWLGKQMHGLEKPGAAEEAWKKAIEANPKDVESRLQLAALLAVQFRYSEAREQLRAVLRRVPKEERALRLRRTIDHLEGRKR